MGPLTQGHWTDDQELLERYLLERVDAQEKSDLDAHARSCEVCQHAIRSEGLLIAGIRRSGRDQMKRQFQSILLSASRTRVPWRQLVAAAAVIVVLVGVGMFNDWFSIQHHEPLTPTVISPQPPSQDKPLEKTSREKGISPTPPPSGARVAEEPKDEASRILPPAKEDESALPRMVAPRREKGPELAAGASPAQETMAEGKSLTEEPQPIWVDGNYLERDSQVSDAAKPTSNAARDALRSLQSPAPAKARLAEGFIVRQQPASTLPMTQQVRQTQIGYRTLQTKVETTDGNVRLTLYPESPFDPRDIQEGLVERISPDSLLLTIGGKQIGYRLPQGWDAQTQRAGKTRR